MKTNISRNAQKSHTSTSGVAKAFPSGRLAHPEGQNEEENKKKIGKNKKKW